MTPDVERQLMRLLHGEMTPAESADWRARLATEPELAARHAELERLWNDLELPEPSPAGPGLAAAVRRRLTDDPPLRDLWRLAPAWDRALAAATLAVGIGLGVLAGSGSEARADATWIDSPEPTLAESFWLDAESGAAADDSEVMP